MKPNIPLTWMTRQLKEMAEKDQDEFGESEEGEIGAGDTGTLTRRSRHQHSDDATLKRHHTLGNHISFNLFIVDGAVLFDWVRVS